MSHDLIRTVIIAAALAVGPAIQTAAPSDAGPQRAAAGQLPPESNAWFDFEPATDDFGPTILDVSQWIEAPTGKHGFVTVRGDRFVFEDGTPVRFWGSQTGSRRDNPEYSAQRMPRQGINLIRQHGNLNNPGGLDATIARLGKNGVYMALDIHYPLNYRYRPGEIPGWPEGGSSQHVQFFNEKAAALHQQRLVNFFTHMNPHTGKRWCDDPTLAMIEILNEASMFWGEVNEPLRVQVEEKYSAWLRAKYGDNEGLKKAWAAGGTSGLEEGEGLEAGQKIALLPNRSFTAEYFRQNPHQKARGQDQMRFYFELEDNYWTANKDALRKAGVKVPITGTAWQGNTSMTTRVHMLAQSKMDYIDRHGYWAHPQGQGNLRWSIATATFDSTPMIKAMHADQKTLMYLGRENLVIEKAWEQVLGKPLTISEWSTVTPNWYSLEGTGLMAVYGLLHGWDGPLESNYQPGDWTNRMGPNQFNLFGNPPHILQFPAAMAMWYRQDVKEADVIAETVYTKEGVFETTDDVKPLPLPAALIGKVGYRFADKPRKPVVKNIDQYWDPKTLTARSITKELTWNGSDGVVTVNTPRTQAVIGFLAKGHADLRDVVVKSPTDFGALWVTAMDGMKPVESARRILITAVGPARNTGMEYEILETGARRGNPVARLKSMGEPPIQLQAVLGEVEIQTSHAGTMKAWALNVVGKRLAEVPLARKPGKVVLAMDAKYKTVYYELAADSVQ
jgi:hypothetical protein